MHPQGRSSVSPRRRVAGVYADRFPRSRSIRNAVRRSVVGEKRVARPSLTVVLAVAADDADALRRAAAFLERRSDYAYVVVTDGDSRAVERALGTHGCIEVVAISADLGHAAAMRAGSLRATTAFVAFADLGYDLREVDLDRAIAILEHDAAAAVTFPRAGAERAGPRVIAGACRRLYRALVKRLLGVELRAAYAPVKVFRRERARAPLRAPALHLARLRCRAASSGFAASRRRRPSSCPSAASAMRRTVSSSRKGSWRRSRSSACGRSRAPRAASACSRS